MHMIFGPPDVEDEVLPPFAESMQDRLFPGTQELDPATAFGMRGERATLDAVSIHRQQRRHDKPQRVLCHAQDDAGPLVGPVGEHRPDARPERQDALT
jgi:hypothetical protein